jgi:5-methylcytosine-specific restriction endonuclease McrA
MSQRILRLNLWKENPFCCYCGIKTELVYIRNGILPDNAATIEHCISRNKEKRHLLQDKVEKKIACHRCNHDKGNQENSAGDTIEKLKRNIFLLTKRIERIIYSGGCPKQSQLNSLEDFKKALNKYVKN